MIRWTLVAAMFIPAAIWAADVTAQTRPAQARVARMAALPRTDIRLLDGELKIHQDRHQQMLLEKSPDRYLAWYRKEAGLAQKAEPYGGWERSGLAGHNGGHYLSAISLMYQVTGNAELKRRIDYMVDELAACQEANGNGYLAAIPGGKQIFADVAAGKPIRGWVPWYNLHKVFAGLRDAYLATENPKARETLARLGNWCGSVIANLNDTQMQAMLSVEHGGMPEVLADLYALTGDARYLDAAKRFCHRALLDPMSRGQDMLNGWHANTQVPKVVGFERIHELTGEGHYDAAARFFWKTVVENRTYAQGGNSDREHFYPPARTADHIYQNQTAETCNVYNMLKLTRQLYSHHPEPAYLDYAERALLNQIIASHELQRGMFTYFQSMRAGHFHTFSDAENSEWCCFGTGMENPALYADGAFWSDREGITVALYIPAEVTFRDRKVTLRQETRFPAEDTVRIAMTLSEPQAFALRLRAPGWLAAPMQVEVNGKPVPAEVQNGVVTLQRQWSNADVVTVRLPMQVRIETAIQSPRDIAFLYGPVVLCGDLGDAGLKETGQWKASHFANEGAASPAVPPLVAENDTELLSRVQRQGDEPLAFGMQRPGSDAVLLRPYGQMQHRRYVTYWKRYTPAQWQEVRNAEEAREAARRELQGRTVSLVTPGEQQQEVEHAMRGERTNTGTFRDRKWRDARGWFSYDVECDPAAEQLLRCTWWGGDAGRSFRILIEGNEIAQVKIPDGQREQFIEVDYPIPLELSQGKRKLTARFEADPGNIAGGLFELRILKAR